MNRLLSKIASVPRKLHSKYRNNRRLLRTWWGMRVYTARLRASNGHARVVIGALYSRHDTKLWMVTDIPFLDATRSDHWARLFRPATIDRVLSEHVFEHLTIDQFRAFLRAVRPYMAVDGFIRGAVPDGYNPDPAYIDYVKVGGIGRGASDHKVLYNCSSLTGILKEEGYDYRLLEYYDENGMFHEVDWSMDDGKIRRSIKFEQPNQERPMEISSLIVDFWPKKGE